VLTDPTGWNGVKSTTAAENVYAPLVMVSLGERTLAGQTVYHNELIDTNFDPP
jgi:hypothetical protein